MFMNRTFPTWLGESGHRLIGLPPRLLRESQVGNWHRCIPWRTIRLCPCYWFSAESGADSREDGFRSDDRRRHWWGGFEDGFELVDYLPMTCEDVGA